SPRLLSVGTIPSESGRPDFSVSRTTISYDTWVQLPRGTCTPISHGTGFATRAYGSPSCPSGPSEGEPILFAGDVHAGTAEPGRVHGHRPWFHYLMTKNTRTPKPPM